MRAFVDVRRPWPSRMLLAVAVLLLIPALPSAAQEGDPPDDESPGDESPGVEPAGDDSNDDGDRPAAGASSSAKDEVGSSYAAMYCDYETRCWAPYLMEVSYGDVATCRARAKLTALRGLDLPGSSSDYAQMRTCYAAMTAAGCMMYAKLLPECSTIGGEVPNGGVCTQNGECVAGSYCSRKDFKQSCGVCQTAGRVGATCDPRHQCATDLRCVAKRCVVQAGEGETCNAGLPCNIGLSCVGGSCTSPHLAAGAACDEAMDLCAGSFACTSGTCKPVKLVRPGDACSDDVGMCTHGSSCFGGKCVAAAADGAACDQKAGPTCLRPAECIDGRCQMRTPATCR